MLSHDSLSAACGFAVLAAAAALIGAQTADPPAVSERARLLHAQALVFDGHVHAVDRECYHGGDIGQRKPDGQFDLPRAKEGGLEMNRLGMAINVSHASDEAISAAIDASAYPVMATHHGLRAVNDIPRNMPDWLMKKLTARGGLIGFQLGNEFHNRKAFDWVTAHAGKAFWDTAAIQQRGTQVSISELDPIVGPQFPRQVADIPEDIRMTVDAWVGVVDLAIQLVGEDHVALVPISMEAHRCPVACATSAICR